MVILLAAASLPASALFTLQRIEVEGAKTLTPDAVRAASGLEPGSRSIFTINAQEVTRRLLRHPWIASAQVRARPPHTILIRIGERVPVAAVPAARGDALVGGAGGGLGGGGVGPELGPGSGRVGRGEEIPSPATRAGLTILPQLPEALRVEVAHLQVTRTQEVFLYTTDGLEIRARPLRGLRQRMAAAPEILRTVRAQGTPLEYIDLSLPGQAIIKPRPVP